MQKIMSYKSFVFGKLNKIQRSFNGWKTLIKNKTSFQYFYFIFEKCFTALKLKKISSLTKVNKTNHNSHK